MFHTPPYHPHYFNIEDWEKFYREDLHRIYRRITRYLKDNRIEELFRGTNYTSFVEYVFANSDKYRLRVK